MLPALAAVKLADGSRPVWPANADRPAGTPVSYGFGWFLDPYRGHARMWHYGDTMGFHSYIERFVPGKLSIIVLCNRTDLDPEALARRVSEVFFMLQSLSAAEPQVPQPALRSRGPASAVRARA